mmetsp:Transcript_19039/g.30227  ORF Transcript_19039/g.30227 Transcript_19039/m.30227 type:complete len:106 (+) Transcript_19039:19-336(+)
MGNKLDPRCKSIYEEYYNCYVEWKKNTDWREYYHEGQSEECQEILTEFQYCGKEQISRMTGYVPAAELMQIRDEIKERQEKEKLQQQPQEQSVASSTNTTSNGQQ